MPQKSSARRLVVYSEPLGVAKLYDRLCDAEHRVACEPTRNRLDGVRAVTVHAEHYPAAAQAKRHSYLVARDAVRRDEAYFADIDAGYLFKIIAYLADERGAAVLPVVMRRIATAALIVMRTLGSDAVRRCGKHLDDARLGEFLFYRLHDGTHALAFEHVRDKHDLAVTARYAVPVHAAVDYFDLDKLLDIHNKSI